MGYLKYVTDLWRKRAYDTDEFSARIMEWRQSNATVRVDKPTRIDRARALGYKAKQGVFMVRQRLIRGGRQREQMRAGRRSKHNTRRKIVDKSYQTIAEERVSRAYPNCEVLNSYFLAKDGRYYYFEVILVERENSRVKSDPQLSWVSRQKGRAHRGLTASAKRSRGLLTRKGKGAEKVRPSKEVTGR
ncbi:hypothetical protein AUJ68_02970 [Candidatus Woesearchaeota archaeon CG1_02_57_44]|nr:MAG: hypothetical protein AUJ68_02970 [Candidatus Woesearchaeota archaeon CG1_02_57_44]PIN69888.1 MAG: 50S ribosomal protein L15e [Candidatus Woesearchaeota archaeon CG11_big_fil_rev_8_21_14_0_20_57_5]